MYGSRVNAKLESGEGLLGTSESGNETSSVKKRSDLVSILYRTEIMLISTSIAPKQVATGLHGEIKLTHSIVVDVQRTVSAHYLLGIC